MSLPRESRSGPDAEAGRRAPGGRGPSADARRGRAGWLPLAGPPGRVPRRPPKGVSGRHCPAAILHRLRELLPEPRATREIREQERDGSRRPGIHSDIIHRLATRFRQSGSSGQPPRALVAPLSHPLPAARRVREALPACGVGCNCPAAGRHRAHDGGNARARYGFSRSVSFVGFRGCCAPTGG